MDVTTRKLGPVSPPQPPTPTRAPVEPPKPKAPAIAQDANQVQARELPDEAPDAEIPEVDFSRVEVKGKPEVPFYKKALDFFLKALSYSPLMPMGPAVQVGMAIYEDRIQYADMTPEMKQSMRQLAARGLMSAADGEGPAVEDVVQELLDQGADPAKLEQILGQVLHSGRIQQMEGKSTCPTAVVQSILAEVNPGAYVRIAYELNQTGASTLPDGTAISVSEENMAWIKAQNFPPDEHTNALFQVALAEAAVAPDRYDVATDTVEKSVNVYGRSYEWQENDGIDYRKVLRVYERAGLPVFDPRAHAGGTREARKAALEKAIAENQSQLAGLSVPVAAGDGKSYHMVEIVGVNDKGEAQVHDPRTGSLESVPMAQLVDRIGWDINSASNVGNPRSRPRASGSGEF